MVLMLFFFFFFFLWGGGFYNGDYVSDVMMAAHAGKTKVDEEPEKKDGKNSQMNQMLGIKGASAETVCP